MLARALSLAAVLALARAATYDTHNGKNCYTGAGGVNLEATITLTSYDATGEYAAFTAGSDAPDEACQKKCDENSSCTCYVVFKASSSTECHLRSSCDIGQCVTSDSWRTYIDASPPTPTPPTPPPTPAPICIFADDVDYDGGGAGSCGADLTVASEQECCDVCTACPDCYRAVLYGNVCYYKGRETTPRASSGRRACVTSASLVCPAGQHAGAFPSGAANRVGPCTACVAGQYSSANSGSACAMCPPGQHTGSSAGSGACNGTACVAGRYAQAGAASEAEASCAACPPGQHTGGKAGSSTCAACLPGQHTDGLEGSGACSGTACVAGRYGPAGAASVAEASCAACLPGQYASEAGSGACSGTACVAGKYGLAGTAFPAMAVCAACPPGQHTGGLVGSSACSGTACVAGRYGPAGAASAANASCAVCPPGQHTDGLAGSSACLGTACVAGRYSPAGAASVVEASCAACLPGQSASAAGSGACSGTACVAGKYGPAGAALAAQTSCAQCEAGRWTSAGASACTTSTRVDGSSWVRGGASAVANLAFEPALAVSLVDELGAVLVGCEGGAVEIRVSSGPGALCNRSAAGGAASCAALPNGTATAALTAAGTATFPGLALNTFGTHNLSARVLFPEASPCASDAAGNFSVAATLDALCSSCDPGFACPSSTQQIGCPVGAACSAGTQLVCPAGKYQPAMRQTSCLECVPGRFQGSAGASECSPCKAGTFSAERGAQAASTCLPCPSGKFGGAAAASSCEECLAAAYSVRDAAAAAAGELLTNCSACGPGRYSEGGASRCTLCAAGRYGDASVGLGTPLCLGNCPAGLYSGTSGATACSNCTAGTYQPSEGQVFCPPCPAGKYSGAVATVCVACPEGQWSALASGACAICERGTYRTASMEGCAECGAGERPFANGTGCAPYCSVGHFCLSGLEFNCSLGFYQDAAGQSTCKTCPGGKYQDDQASSDCKACSAATCKKGFRRGCGGASQGYCSTCTPGTFVAQSACAPCSPGSYSDAEDATECKACEGGQFQAAAGKSFCTVQATCAAGRRTAGAPNATSDRTCATCVPGTFSSGANAEVCTECPLGTHQALVGQTSCDACAAGARGKPSAGTPRTGSETHCEVCPPGSFSAAPGASACTVCEGCAELGSARNGCGGASAGVCISCSVGTYKSSVTGRCEMCEAGQYQDTAGQVQCTLCSAIACASGSKRKGCGGAAEGYCGACSPGKFVSVEGCADCPSGKFSAAENAADCTACSPCPNGVRASCGPSFAGFCQSCPAGKWFDANLDCSICPAGMWCQDGAQFKCGSADLFCVNGSATPSTVAVGHYSVPIDAPEAAREGQVACEPGFECTRGIRQACPPGRVCLLNTVATVFTARGTAQVVNVTAQERCEDNEFVFNGKCSICPEKGADCRDGLLTLEPDYWYDPKHGQLADFWGRRNRKELEGTDIYRCAKGSCVRNATTGLPACTEGRSGTLCAVCESGYYATSSLECKTCPTVASSAQYIVALLAIAGIVKTALVAKAKVERTHPKLASSMREKLPEVLKLLTGMFQIIGAFATVLYRVPWPDSFTAVMRFFGFLNLDLFALPNIRCSSVGATFMSRFVVHLVTMLCATACFVGLLAYSYSKANHRRASPLSHDFMWNLFLPFLFLIYPSISKTVLLMLRCREIDGVRYLLSDMSQSCETADYASHRNFAVFGVVVFPIGTVVFFTALVARQRHKLPPDWWPAQAPQQAKLAYQAYKKGRGMAKPFSTWKEEQWDPQMLKYSKVYRRFGFLFAAYTKRFWWFEGLITIYKLCMTVLIVFVSDVDELKILFGMLGATSLMAVYAFFQPFKHPDILSINTVAQIVVLLVLFSASFLLVSGSSVFMAVVLVALTIAPIVAGIFLVLRLPDDAHTFSADDILADAVAARLRAKTASKDPAQGKGIGREEPEEFFRANPMHAKAGANPVHGEAGVAAAPPPPPSLPAPPPLPPQDPEQLSLDTSHLPQTEKPRRVLTKQLSAQPERGGDADMRQSCL